MTKRIFRSMVITAGAVLLATLVIIMGCLYEYFCGVQEQQLKDELSLAVAAMQQGEGEPYLQSLNSDRYRLTWVAADGTVLYDTRTDAETMENHAQRQEIQQALLAGQGESSRYSSTLLEKTSVWRTARCYVSPSAAPRRACWCWVCSSRFWWCWRWR